MSSQVTLLKRIARLTFRARALLVWERFAPVLAFGVAAVLLFMAASFAGIWERIGDPWRLIGLLVALWCFGKALWRARTVKRPSASEAARRVEHDSGLEHRPFDSVQDTAARTPNTDTALWDAHSAKAATAAASALAARARPALAPIDTYYARFIVPCLVVLALMVGTGDNFERLRRSIHPSWMSALDARTAKFDAWIDPPDYTGRPPVYFKTKSQLKAPAGSELVARVNGVKDVPRLLIVENGRSRRVPITRLGPTSFEARTVLTQSAKARWRIGSAPKLWRIEIEADTAPKVSWNEDPTAGPRDTLDFAYDLTDDFGVTSLSLALQRVNDLARAGVEPAETETIELSLGSETVRDAKATAEQLNLTKHKWAGEKVVARLIARDFKGQVGASEPRTVIVPDKIFISPIAKAAVENRALLLAAKGMVYAPVPILDPRVYPRFTGPLPQTRIERAPGSVKRVALLLDIVTDSPVGAFKDPVVYMGLKNVQSRVEQAREMDDLSDAPEDLWLIAMRAEFGPLGNAKEAMQRAEHALRDGIARRARQREIDTLFTRYNDAVERYMEFLMQSATTVDGDGNGGGGDRNADEIQALLDAIEEANRLGDTEGARRALAQLAELLENMQIQLTKGGEGEGGESDDGLSDDVKEALENLADTIGEQRELQDETREAQKAQESQEQQDSGGSPNEGQDGALTAGSDPNVSGEGQDGEPDSAQDTPATPEQLAQNQAALSSAIDALEEALKNAGTNMNTVAPQDRGPDSSSGSSLSEDGQPQNGSGGAAIDDPDAPLGSGGQDPDGEGVVSLSPQDALDAAREAMAAAQKALGQDAFGEADQAQDDAIEAMKKAAEALIAQGNQGAGGGEDTRGGQDPFGRDSADGEGLATGETDIPGVSDRQRARDLIEELRRRAADQGRTLDELEYLERLLERF